MERRDRVLDAVGPRVEDVVPGEGRDPDPGPGERAEVSRIGGRRRDVDAARHPAARVRHLDLADHQVGRQEQLAARLEERVRIGLVEDQVAEQQQPRRAGHDFTRVSMNRDSDWTKAASSQSRASALFASISSTGMPASSRARVTK